VDEEIAFTIEHINSGLASRVVLVIPQNAALISSAVSMKILARRLLNTEKYVILVSDDKTGAILGEKASLVVVPKISDVIKETWNEAKRLKDKLISEKNHIKKELLGERKIEETAAEEIVIPAISEATAITNDLMPTSEKLVKATVEEPKVDSQVEIKANQESINLLNKPRLPVKIIEINGIQLAAGGDITLEELPVTADTREVQERNKMAETEKKAANIKALENFGTMPENNFDESNKLVGKDFGRMVSQTPPVSRRLPKTKKKINFNFLKKYLSGFSSIISYITRGNNSLQFLKLGIVLLVLFFIGSYIFLPAVKVNLSFNQDEVRVNELVKASAKVDELNLETLTLPAFKLTKTSTGSLDAKPSGKGNTGLPAKGVVDIHNNTASDVTLEAGKIITNISSQLKYKLMKQVIVPKDNPKGVVDVPIEAVSFGANYNIENNRATFQAEGYTTDQIVAYAFRDVTGGTTLETIVVSKEDLDALKAKLEEQLKADLLSKVKSLLSSEDKLLEGSEQFQTIKFTTSAKEADKVEQISADMEMTITALKVTQSDLKAIAKEIVRLKNTSTQNAQIDLANILIENIKVENEEATFSIRFDANVQEDTDINTIKDAIKGKKTSEAREYLKNLQGVKEATLKYTPSYIPQFLQKVPKDVNKIEIIKSTN